MNEKINTKNTRGRNIQTHNIQSN